jgi:hypothetical protein
MQNLARRQVLLLLFVLCTTSWLCILDSKPHGERAIARAAHAGVTIH